MKRLKFLIIVFFITLSIPLAYFISQAYQSLEQEELDEFEFFATTLLDEMEEELVALILREEKRPVDEYNYYLSSEPLIKENERSRSPLSKDPQEDYILGYFQNNPDGSFQTPLVETGKTVLSERRSMLAFLQQANTLLNQRRTTISEEVETPPIGEVTQVTKEERSSLAKKYLDVASLREQKFQRGKEEQQVQNITVEQALRITQEDHKQKLLEEFKDDITNAERDTVIDSLQQTEIASLPGKNEIAETASQQFFRSAYPFSKNLEVEVGPMQSIFLSEREILIFRHIVIDNQIYRQGFILLIREFLNYLKNSYFITQPIANFSHLRLEVTDQGQTSEILQAGTVIANPIFSLYRIFPRPFSFLGATLTSNQIPRSAGRDTLNVMMVLIGTILVLGLLAIYQSARAIVELSERRSVFVSSVTHELKTPLTNIRMYIEMLEQGIAPNREREEEYFRVLGSESQRLSRLIDNVLEFSKLEKKQRRFNLQEGRFEDVIQEVGNIMQEKLRQEGFILNVERDDIQPFHYDREVMVQILLNLIENSIKFGKSSPRKEITLRLQSKGKQLNISVSDSGPGIPRTALKKVFHDFYRGEHEVTRATRGTGIGLALVKKFVTALGGRVEASNNKGSGCTITISLPGGKSGVLE